MTLGFYFILIWTIISFSLLVLPYLESLNTDLLLEFVRESLITTLTMPMSLLCPQTPTEEEEAVIDGTRNRPLLEGNLAIG